MSDPGDEGEVGRLRSLLAEARAGLLGVVAGLASAMGVEVTETEETLARVVEAMRSAAARSAAHEAEVAALRADLDAAIRTIATLSRRLDDAIRTMSRRST